MKGHPLKCKKIKKPSCPSRQFLKTVNFAFIKIFDFLVKIALFRASLLFSGVYSSPCARSYGSTFKIPSINDGLNPNLAQCEMTRFMTRL